MKSLGKFPGLKTRFLVILGYFGMGTTGFLKIVRTRHQVVCRLELIQVLGLDGDDSVECTRLCVAGIRHFS